jgi:hypothetical protein
MTFINILGNVYPVLLQRMHRARVQRLRLKFRKIKAILSWNWRMVST